MCTSDSRCGSTQIWSRGQWPWTIDVTTDGGGGVYTTEHQTDLTTLPGIFLELATWLRTLDKYQNYSDEYRCLHPYQTILERKCYKTQSLGYPHFDTTTPNWLTINRSSTLPTVQFQTVFELGLHDVIYYTSNWSRWKGRSTAHKQ